jgi:hypothetical protein
VRRWWVTLALLLSLGINLGLLAAVAAGRWADRREAAEEPPPAPALRGDDRELAGELGGEMIVEVPAGEPLGATEDAPAPDVHDPTEAAPGGRGPHRRIGSHGPGGAPGEPPLGRLADHLGLAGERRERFIALQRGFVRAHLQARGERARLGAALRQELVAQVPDAARIDELIAGLGETYLASERATAEVVLASRELLDDEQRRTYLRFLQRLRHDGPHGAPYDGPRPGGRRRHR